MEVFFSIFPTTLPGMIKKLLHYTILYVSLVSFWVKNKSALIAKKKMHALMHSSQLVSQKP